jgi:hypothetical protein
MHPVCLAFVFAVAAGKRWRSELPNGSIPAKGNWKPGFAISQLFALADGGQQCACVSVGRKMSFLKTFGTG